MKDEHRETKLDVIYEHYGRDHQMLKLVEESAEMIAALARVLQQYLFGTKFEEDTVKNLREEFADTRIVMDQLDGRALDNSLLQILDSYKINRTVLRIFQEAGTTEGMSEKARDTIAELLYTDAE